MAVMDTANKRRAIINQISRTHIGLVPNNDITLDDVQNYAWIYPFLTYPASIPQVVTTGRVPPHNVFDDPAFRNTPFQRRAWG